MHFNALVFFIVYLLFTSIGVWCLLNLFALNTTFKILFNILCFILCNAFTLVLLGLDFLGIVYAVVYAGAILVLFLSVLMLVDLRAEDTAEIILTQAREKEKKKLFFLRYGVLAVYILSMIYVYAYLTAFYTDPNKNFLEINTEIPVMASVFHSRNIIYWLSESIYTAEVTLFLTIGAIFFLAMIGSISLILNEVQKIAPTAKTKVFILEDDDDNDADAGTQQQAPRDRQ